MDFLGGLQIQIVIQKVQWGGFHAVQEEYGGASELW